MRQFSEEGIRTDIQGLRAIAMSSVALFHAEVPLFGGGYVGVDIFFVISGYLITGLLVREVEQRGRIDFMAFYARRIRRLLPAALLVLVATELTAYFLLSPLEQRELIRTFLASALYMSNFWFATQATDYLAGDLHANPLLHTWSLAVEEQFYLAWPLLIFLAARAGRAKRMTRRLIVIMAVVLAGSLATSLWLTAVAQPWAFFASPTRAWEFAAGGLAYMASGRLAPLTGRSKDILVAVGFATMIASIFLFDNTIRFPGSAAMLPVVGTVLVIAPGVGHVGRLSRLFDHSAFQVLGRLSYSWYLWHWPVLVFPAVLRGPLDLKERLLWVAVSLGLAAFTYYAVENRIRLSPTLAYAPLRTLTLGVLLTTVGIGSAATLRELAKNALATTPQAAFNAVREDLPAIYKDGCHLPFDGVSLPDCVYAHPSAGRTMVLFGDSHAAQWFPALERIAQEAGWRLVSLTKSACPSVTISLRNTALARPYEECAVWRSSVLRRIARDRPTLVVLANSYTYINDPRQHIDTLAWQAGLEATLRQVRQSGAAVAVMHDTPQPGFDVPVCLSRAAWRRSMDSCDFDRDSVFGPRILKSVQAAVGTMDRVFLVDLSEMLCDASRCLAMIDGWVAYRDNHHLTTTVSTLLAPALRARMMAVLPELKS